MDHKIHADNCVCFELDVSQFTKYGTSVHPYKSTVEILKSIKGTQTSESIKIFNLIYWV